LAGLTATLGFFIIPAKKKQARTLFSKNITNLRQKLNETLTSEFGNQVNHVISRINDTISPYSRFVRSEQNLLESNLKLFKEFDGRIQELKNEITKMQIK
jgi:methionyl-tRNA synthetase